MANNTLEIFETNNFGLETFIHVHDIRYESSYKDEFGTRYWRYLRTPRLDEVINEYTFGMQRCGGRARKSV